MPKRSRLNNNLFFSNSIEELNIAKIAQRYDDKKLDVTCYSEILEERKGRSIRAVNFLFGESVFILPDIFWQKL